MDPCFSINRGYVYLATTYRSLGDTLMCDNEVHQPTLERILVGGPKVSPTVPHSVDCSVKIAGPCSNTYGIAEEVLRN